MLKTSGIYLYCWPHIRQKHLPLYQYTARDMSTGAVFFALACENTSTHAMLFLCYVAQHLNKYGINLQNLQLQTDNGSEFIGHWKKREKSAFTKLAEDYFHMKHYRIPPHQSTFNSDVESFHGTVERTL